MWKIIYSALKRAVNEAIKFIKLLFFTSKPAAITAAMSNMPVLKIDGTKASATPAAITAAISNTPVFTVDEAKASAKEIYDGLCKALLFQLFPQLEEARELRKVSVLERAVIVFKKYQLSYKDGVFSFDEKSLAHTFSAQEAILTARALYDLMKRIERQHRGTDLECYAYLKDIYLLLLRPHCLHLKKLMTNEDVDTLNKIQADANGYCSRFMRRKEAKPRTAESSAISIQRAYRQHRFLRQHKETKVRTYAWLQENLPKDFEKYPITLTPSLPSIDCAINREKARKWVDAHPPHSQPIAKKIIQATVHRSYKKFDNNLRLALHSFNKKIMSFSADKRAYILVLPYETKLKSNSWVASLALKYLHHAPQAILFLSEVKPYVADEKNKNIQHALLLDDAMYSGKQFDHASLGPLRYNLSSAKNILIHVVIPFISQIGLCRLKNQKDIYLHRFELMLSLEQLSKFGIFSDEELAYLDKSRKNKKFSASVKTLTYFDHKIADFYSTLDWILAWGCTIEGDSATRFIPYANSPYRS